MEKYEKYKEDEVLTQWFDEGNFAEKTKKSYYQSMEYYVQFTGLTPIELKLQAENEEDRGIRMANRSHVKYIRNFRKWLEDRRCAPRSIEDHMSAVHSFYRKLMIQLPEKPPHGRKNLPKALPQNVIPMFIDDVRDILKVADVLERAIVLCGCTSGLSLSDLTSLTVGDFTHGYDPETQITTLLKWDAKTQTKSPLIRQKTGIDFFTFLTPEASQSVWDYLNFRSRKPIKGNNPVRRRQLQKQYVTREEGYLFILKNVSDDYLTIQDDESHEDWEKRYAELVANETDEEWQKREDMRKYHENAFIRMYQRLSDRANKLNPSGYNIGRSHNARKFFSSTLKNAIIPGVDNFFVEFVMGHKIPDSQKPYFIGDPKKQCEKFKNCVPFLTINKTINVTESPEYQKLLEANKTMLLETQKHVVERQELQDLRGELEASRQREADKVDRSEFLALQRELAKTRAALEDYVIEEHLREEDEKESRAYQELQNSLSEEEKMDIYGEKLLAEETERNQREYYESLSDEERMDIFADELLSEEAEKNQRAYWESRSDEERNEAHLEEYLAEENEKAQRQYQELLRQGIVVRKPLKKEGVKAVEKQPKEKKKQRKGRS